MHWTSVCYVVSVAVNNCNLLYTSAINMSIAAKSHNVIDEFK